MASTYVPLVGGNMTGPLVNSTSITAELLNAKLVGATLQANQFPGADASAKINSCLQTAVAAAGGTCDARGFSGNQTMNQTIEILNKTSLLLPHVADWCWNFTDGTSVGIQQDGGSSLIGSAAGGGGNNMLLTPCSANTSMLALYATQNNPAGGSAYVYASGFNAQNLIGAKFSKGVVYTRYLFDESKFERITAINTYGDAWHVYYVCCDTNFEDVQASSAYGAAGGTPLVIETGGLAELSWSGTVNSAGKGHPNIDIQTGNVELDFWNLYAESGDSTPGSPNPADISTAVVNIAGNPIVRFYGGISSMNTTKPCFNNSALVTVNNSWCLNNHVPAVGLSCPYNGAIYGTDNQFMYVCAANRVRRLALQ